MAARIPAPSFFPLIPPDAGSPMRKRVDSFFEPLPGLMEKLTTRGLPQSPSASKDVKTTSGSRDRFHFEHDEQAEYSQITSNINRKMREDGEDCIMGEEPLDTWKGDQDTAYSVGKSLVEIIDSAEPLNELAVRRFIFRHQDLLPRKLETNVDLMGRVLTDLLQVDLPCPQEQLGATFDYPINLENDAKIKKGLRELMNGQGSKRIEKDLLSLVMVESAVLKFYDKYASQYSKEPAVILRRVLIDLRAELLVEKRQCDRATKQQQDQQKREAFKQAYTTYHKMLNSGRSGTEAMEVVRMEQNADSEEEQLSPQGEMNSSALSDCDNIYDDSDDEMRLEEFSPVRQAVRHVEDHSQVSVARSAILHQAKTENDYLGDATMNDDSDETSIDSYGTNDWIDTDSGEDEVKTRGRAPGSPPKRRIVSRDRNPSPPKREKVSDTKSRGIYTEVEADITPKKKKYVIPAKKIHSY
ncbi:uncharacterized protein LY89DRAFT_776408 [Mollisia scopiformis]|uniref:Uncharacterized protein n=1 Tax=Mollisia scopiformis TaxID=149040 RepID=A0A194XX08_MOLSC|nr:uncharacterized protein LY89DRAFT_776408 [Mollisia scopiformis]KUJ24701.1 hypothetical protein LY89DRAFT_776408 [Mollisia scopiformis]